jgi:hypothetical protein
MAESVRQRHLNGQPTFGLFIDLLKAYDRVPHGALYRVLEHRGICGKFLNTVKAMYKSSNMRVRTCGKLAEPFDMWRGLRQGCPLSLLLIIIFIDHLLVDTRPSETGIAVPASKGQTSRGVPTLGRLCFNLDGGMYADDIVCFEETLDMMKQQCINIVEWGKKWGMNCNFAKSGIMLWSYDAGLRAVYSDATFGTAEGTFPKVSSDKYLGIEVSEDLPMFMGGDTKNLLQGRSTDALQYAKSLAAKGLTALSTLKLVLSDPACPIPLKSELIKAFVMSVMMYGSEFVGFNKRLAQSAQQVINLAVRWCVGLKKSNKMTSGLVLSVELGLPQMYEVYGGQRAWLYHKLKFGDPPMESLLVSLQKYHAFHLQRTWCSEKEFWLKCFHAPRNRSREWKHRESGINKYVPYEIEPIAEVLKGCWEVYNPRKPDVWTFYRAGFDWMKEHVTQWYLDGAIRDTNWGDQYETRRCWKIKVPKDPSPIRGWYSFARMVELHRQSNPYQSKVLVKYHQMVLGVDENGRFAIDPHILTNGVLTALLKELKSTDLVAEVCAAERDFRSDKLTWKTCDLVVERQYQEVVIGSKKSDDGA